MLISCDLPRHALLIHFGKQNRERLPSVITPFKGIEIAIDENCFPKKLVAIHFVRHCFNLPFNYEGKFAISGFSLSMKRINNETQLAICVSFCTTPVIRF